MRLSGDRLQVSITSFQLRTRSPGLLARSAVCETAIPTLLVSPGLARGGCLDSTLVLAPRLGDPGYGSPRAAGAWRAGRRRSGQRRGSGQDIPQGVSISTWGKSSG